MPAQLQLLTSVWVPCDKGMEIEIDTLREVCACALTRPRLCPRPVIFRYRTSKRSFTPIYLLNLFLCARQRLFTILEAQEVKKAASGIVDSNGSEGEVEAEVSEGGEDAGMLLSEAMLDVVASKREALVVTMTDMPLTPSDTKDAAQIEGAWDAFVSLYHEICRLKVLAGMPGRVPDIWDGKDKQKKKKKKKRQ